MAKEISPLGWVLIILVVALTISLYISLFSKLKQKPEKPGWINSMQEAGKTLKDPFRRENARMEELSRNVEKLTHHHANGENTGNQAGE